ncbi:MAG: YceI family protein [Actinomycetales bacterium]
MTATTTPSLTGNYTIDAAHTTIGFVARHAMVTKVRGAFNDFEGTAVIAPDVTDSTVSLTIQVASVDTRNDQRDAHLASADFFDAEQFGTISFVSTNVRQDGDVFEITGDLTIKDVTRPVTVPFSYEGSATDPFGNERVGFEGSVVVNRKDFGLTWNAALETGGVLVSDKVTLEFEVSAIKA